MAKIPGFVFIVIGVLLTAVSFYINKSQRTNSLEIFVYVGYIFIAYGLAKIIIRYILGKGNPKVLDGKELPDDVDGTVKAQKLDQRNLNVEHHKTEPIIAEQKMPHEQRIHEPKMGMYGYIGYCTRCGTPMRKINRFCHRCGLRQNVP